MATITPTNWLEDWTKFVDFTGKSPVEIKLIKLRYRWYVEGYVNAMNTFLRGPNYSIKSFTWSQSVTNPNKFIPKVNLTPRLRRGGGGQQGQIIPKSPKFPPPPTN
jgi:hypothetical protein